MPKARKPVEKLVTSPSLKDLSTDQIVEEVNQRHEVLLSGTVKSFDTCREIGEALIDVKDNRLEHGTFLLWVKENCVFDHRQGQRYMKVFDNWDVIQLAVERSSEGLDDLTLNGAIKLLSSPSKKEKKKPPKDKFIERYTSAAVIEAARSALGDIDLDPCTDKHANKTVQAAKIFTAKDDAIGQDWTGSCWLSPPVGDHERFVEKACASIAAGNLKQCLMLVDSKTNQPWFHRAMNQGNGLAFLTGDEAFVDEDGEVFPQGCGQSLIYIGSNTERFEKAFDSFGLVLFWG